jgi:hypothetical protein
MSELGRQLEGVIITEPAEPTPAARQPEPTQTLDDQGLEALGAELTEMTPSEPKPERPIENLRGEFDRKFRSLQGDMNEIKSMLKQSSVAAAPVTEGSPTADLDRMPIAKLQELRGTLQPEQQTQLDGYLTVRVAREAARQEVAAVNQTQSFESRRTQAAAQAMARYPDISDDGSDFARRVEAKLASLGQDYVARNPRAVLDAANEVAVETGYAPKTRSPIGSLATRQNMSPPAKTAAPSINPRLAARLADGMPGRKFDAKAIAKGREYYNTQPVEE